MNPKPSIPQISVGILFSSLIRFRLNGHYRCTATGRHYTGDYTLQRTGQTYTLQHANTVENVHLPLTLIPEQPENSDFDLTDVVIGIHFHWERKENQKFKGSLQLLDEGEHLTAVNVISLEEYLLSVISSEMSATSSPELLKAHAVVSRSWLLAQQAKARQIHGDYQAGYSTDREDIRWYDREDHQNFDVCADDHCQRYQGISKAYAPAVRQAIEATRGEVLTYENKICDARFSKCCGGVTERFENTWEPVVHPYLNTLIDAPRMLTPKDLSQEENARKWILASPPVFCNTSDPAILSEVLNDYDQETLHFFRWKVEYTVEQLSELICQKSGIDFGQILELVPVERGTSGRIIRLKIIGNRKTKILGKELVIRRILSKTHLYSSAFIVDKQDDRFILHGAGWGHGVGLCQIGAAVMGAQGYPYRQILQHYFPHSQLKKIY